MPIVLNSRALGKGWVVLEEYFHCNTKSLISVLSPRKSREFVARYIEQAYVDKFGSFTEKIAFKKNRALSPFKMENYEEMNPTILGCGHEPRYRAYFCHKLEVHEGMLNFTYRTYSQLELLTHRKDCSGWISVA